MSNQEIRDRLLALTEEMAAACKKEDAEFFFILKLPDHDAVASAAVRKSDPDPIVTFFAAVYRDVAEDQPPTTTLQ